MRSWAIALLVMLGFVLLGPDARAQSPQPTQNNIATQLVAEGPAVPGETLTLAIVMKPKPGWHGYWKNPGDAGIEPRIEWQLPEGFKAGPLRYPVPERLTIAGIMNYVYEGDYAKLVDLQVPAGLKPGTRLPVRARMDYLACTDEICVPESTELATEVRVGAAGEPPARRAEFDRYRMKLPRPLGSEGRFAVKNGRLRLAIPLPPSLPISDAYFCPLTYLAVQ